MKVEEFQELKKAILERDTDGQYDQEITWQEDLDICDNSREFAGQAIWVIISSGMKNQVARIIEDRIWLALRLDKPLYDVFKHKGKTSAIQYIWDNRDRLFNEYRASNDKLGYLQDLPWIGGITKYHLAKNLGLDVVKPDRHIERMSAFYEKSPDKLCADLAEETGYRKSTIDLILWRAANLGLWTLKRPYRIYWIYRADGWFLGGGPCPVRREDLAIKHYRWLLDKYKDVYIQWHPGLYTYSEFYQVAREYAEEIQRAQPGRRQRWYDPAMDKIICLISEWREIQAVDRARAEDAYERLQLGTHDQFQIDSYRDLKHRAIEEGNILLPDYQIND